MNNSLQAEGVFFPEPGEQPAGNYEYQHVLSDRAGGERIFLHFLFIGMLGGCGCGDSRSHDPYPTALVLLDFFDLRISRFFLVLCVGVFHLAT